jgi:signal transduction histidine kinase
MSHLTEKILSALGKALGSEYDLDSILNHLMRELVQNVKAADAGIIYLYDKNRRQLIPQVSNGYPWFNYKCRLNVGEGVPGQCLASRKPLLLTSTKAVAEYTATLRTTNLDCYSQMKQDLTPTCGMIAIPIIFREKIFGVILLEHFNTPHRKFSEADLTQLEALSSWIWLMIDYPQLNLELRDSKRSYRELLGKFLANVEDERRRIAREIHDEINHILLSVKLNLEDMGSTFPSEMVKAREKLKVISSHISQAFDDLHRLSVNLRPPALDELGLPQALDWYIQNLSDEAGLPITLEVKGLSQRRPAPILETQLFRVAQEALSNVLKHAQATSAQIKLNFGRSNLVLKVEDDGKGFDVDVALNAFGGTKNLGLLGMRERAEICGGKLDIHSSPGCGTTLKVVVPISSYDWGTY